jgi:2-amino-4-hydroxy-6-hydroxymethyldihydropteridine diphosphokinase
VIASLTNDQQPTTNDRFSMLFLLALGSNIGNRHWHLAQALARAARIPGFRLLAASRVYESAGWGREDLAPFLNAVAAGESETLSPDQLLSHLQRIEDELGRQRTDHWGPRTLDLDLLAADDVHVDSPRLQLPHPWIAKRPFVYLPMREVAHLHPAWAPLCIAHPDGLAIERESRPVELDSLWPGPALRRPLERETASEEETLAFARELAPYLIPGDVVALDAPMGSGKSVFARGIGRGLGVTGPIQSPSFTLCRRYECAPIPFEHWDFYRLGSEDELESTGYFADESRSAIRAVEWAANFPHAIPANALHVRIESLDAERRRIYVD